MANNDITEDDLQRDPEPNDFSDAAVVRKLNRATMVLTRVNGRVAAIDERFADPMPPTKPQIVEALAALRAQADETLRQVAVLDAKVDPR